MAEGSSSGTCCLRASCLNSKVTKYPNIGYVELCVKNYMYMYICIHIYIYIRTCIFWYLDPKGQFVVDGKFKVGN